MKNKRMKLQVGAFNSDNMKARMNKTMYERIKYSSPLCMFRIILLDEKKLQYDNLKNIGRHFFSRCNVLAYIMLFQ